MSCCHVYTLCSSDTLRYFPPHLCPCTGPTFFTRGYHTLNHPSSPGDEPVALGSRAICPRESSHLPTPRYSPCVHQQIRTLFILIAFGCFARGYQVPSKVPEQFHIAVAWSARLLNSAPKIVKSSFCSIEYPLTCTDPFSSVHTTATVTGDSAVG